MADEILKNVDDVRYEREQLEFRVDAFLRTRGWKHSSSNPASIWLWEKALADGRVVLVDKDAALQFEQMTFTEEG
jgi:hypothetical protein